MRFRSQVLKRLARGLVALVPRAFRQELKNALRARFRAELKAELIAELPHMIAAALPRNLAFVNAVRVFEQRVVEERNQAVGEEDALALSERLSSEWRILLRQGAGLSPEKAQAPSLADLIQEIDFLRANQEILLPVFKSLACKRVLYAGHAYYNPWYLSRALRDRGWKADVLNWDMNPNSQIYYHGEDFSFSTRSPVLTEQMLQFYVNSIYSYDVFHFSNSHGITFGGPVQNAIGQNISTHAEIFLLKELGKKIVYSNNGCLDGVSQTSFSKWGPESVCSICRWRNEPTVCSDEMNLGWGRFRNSVADYQCLLGGNRVDFNDDARVHEEPEFYCLDKEFWNPQIEIPEAFRLPAKPKGTIWLYHAVGNRAERSTKDGRNIKSSHVYVPLVRKLKEQGMLVELLEPTRIPNKDVRYLQAQADIFLEMLTYGWFGANVREAMMLGKPVICFVRPEWLESVRTEIPDYADELPVISATPDSVEGILRDLIANPEKRREIGKRSRAFAIKWHSAEAGGNRFDKIYRRLLQGDSLLHSTSRSESAQTSSTGTQL